MGQEDDRKDVLWGEGSEDADGNPLFNLYFGPKGRRVVFGMHQAIAAFAKSGNNVIVDYIQYEKEWAPDLRAALAGIETCYVGVKIPLEVLENREKERGTSPNGHARSHYDSVHEGFEYDLAIDTSENTPEACATQIIEYLKEPQLAVS